MEVGDYLRYLRGLISILTVVLFSASCNNFPEPEITVEALVSILSNEQYSEVGTQGLINPTKDHFRKLEFNFEVKHSSNTKIEFPQLGRV
ncbi:hypothetical protein PaeBR_15740 [Paenibacillus sp. BR2-3]|uniref:hypothetical protein n=1 Tax=Paenibacillus sp. BR2-3 TaxID=3048494 RepID=UPI003977B600